MRYEEFLEQIQRQAHIGSRGEAERATWATLQTLGERLSGGEAKDFASQLPPPLPPYALAGLAGWETPLPPQDFVQLVADREGTDPQQAKQHTRAVWSVLQQALTPGEVQDIRSQLPTDYDQLFPIA